jgi:hypothetical protein
MSDGSALSAARVGKLTERGRRSPMGTVAIRPYQHENGDHSANHQAVSEGERCMLAD